jgi:hypothetical protein
VCLTMLFFFRRTKSIDHFHRWPRWC